MKALIVSNNVDLLADISALCATRSPPVTTSTMRGGLLDASARLATETPQLIMLDASNADINEIQLVERFSAQYPHAAFVLLIENQSPDLLIRAMRAGVREVLTLPLESKTFHDALDRVEQKNSSLSLKNGTVISFISCKGGSGATFIATNFGHALAAVAHKKVLLIDLNQQFGDAVLYVSDKKPVATLSDICTQINRMDAEFLESSLVNILPNFGILAASDDPTRSVDMKPEHIDTILRLARNYYDYVVLDVGRQIDAITIRALDNSDLIYPVLQLALPYIRDGRRLLDIFRSLGYRREKIRFIVNRFEKSGKLHLPDLEGVLGVKATHTVPNNFEAVSDSVNQGIPVLQLSRNSSVAKSLVELVDKVAGQRATESKGILGRFLGRHAQAGA